MASSLGAEEQNPDDMDDFIQDPLDENVSYLDDRPSTGSYEGSSYYLSWHSPFQKKSNFTSNIKMLSIGIKKGIVYHAFACNIGHATLEEKHFHE